MAAKEALFRCLRCGHEYTELYDHNNVTERSCPQCRSNSIRRLTSKKPAQKK